MWSQTVSALLIVVGMILVVRIALRGLGVASGASTRRSVRVTETCPIGAKQRLVLVEACGERLLLGASEAGVTLIRPLGPAEPAPSEAEEAAEAEAPPAPRTRWRETARTVLRAAGWATGLALCLFAAEPAAAQAVTATTGDDGSSIALSLEGATAPDRIAGTLQILFLMTVMSVAPSILLAATAFTRIVIVLSLLRQAMGIHQLPPNQIIVGLALFVTFYVMAPVGNEIKDTALDPYIAQQIGEEELLSRAMVPVRNFMMENTRQSDLELFTSLAGKETAATIEEVSFAALLPSFMMSEIRTAFEIGFMIYLPFLIVDIVIASMLISMGMIVLPPIIISLPFKLMLFVLLDGWNLVITALVTGLL